MLFSYKFHSEEQQILLMYVPGAFFCDNGMEPLTAALRSAQRPACLLR